MSDHDLSLRALASELERQAKQYEGWPDTLATARQIQRVTAKYCEQCRVRWGIEMIPIHRHGDGVFEIGAEPASEFDAALLEALIEREKETA